MIFLVNAEKAKSTAKSAVKNRVIFIISPQPYDKENNLFHFRLHKPAE
ncbi:hypothetical protein HEMROJRC1_06840 [Rodentibacter sp. JRC1]|nr:hypothetical protein HEMROJRC1_06840 [Rodentibacter sp. JRC1]